MKADGIEADLDLAHRLADTAARIALRYFGPAIPTERKADGSPVTVADREVEAAIIDVLERERPHDAILSEETGARGHGLRRWIIDPIDGTVPFSQGGKGWGTFVALEVRGEVVLGVINHPIDGRRYWALRAQGTRAATTEDGLIAGAERAVRVSEVARLEEARFMAVPPTESAALQALRRASTQVTETYDFLVDLAEGRIDVLLSQGGQVWDHAAEVIIVEEAGGTFRDPEGGRRLDLRGGTYSNGVVDAELGALLGRF